MRVCTIWVYIWAQHQWRLRNIQTHMQKKSRLSADGRTMGNNPANICTVCASASYNMPCGQFDNVIFNERNCIVSHFDVTTVIAISRSDVYLLMLSHYQPTAAFFVCLQFCFLLSNRMLSHSGSAVNNRNVAFMICNLSQTQSGESVADGERVEKKQWLANKSRIALTTVAKTNRNLGFAVDFVCEPSKGHMG